MIIRDQNNQDNKINHTGSFFQSPFEYLQQEKTRHNLEVLGQRKKELGNQPGGKVQASELKEFDSFNKNMKH